MLKFMAFILHFHRDIQGIFFLLLGKRNKYRENIYSLTYALKSHDAKVNDLKILLNALELGVKTSRRGEF